MPTGAKSMPDNWNLLGTSMTCKGIGKRMLIRRLPTSSLQIVKSFLIMKNSNSNLTIQRKQQFKDNS